MTIREALAVYQNIEIDLLLSAVLKKPREFIYLHPELILTTKHLNTLSKYIKRREKGEPVAYILGYKDFMGLRFKVNKDVLIPRPETEGLVELALDRIKNYELGIKNPKSLRILDMGTGSGCIAVTAAKAAKVIFAQRKDDLCRVIAADVSPKALLVAKANARKHKTKIQFIHSDLFQNIKGNFDIIVANLPYVPMKMLRKHLLHQGELEAGDPFAGLKYEPKFALTDGTSIWLIYKKFLEQVRAHLNPGAVILLEIDPASRKFLKTYQEQYLPEAQVKFYRDLNRLWRYMEIKTKGSTG